MPGKADDDYWAQRGITPPQKSGAKRPGAHHPTTGGKPGNPYGWEFNQRANPGTPPPGRGGAHPGAGRPVPGFGFSGRSPRTMGELTRGYDSTEHGFYARARATWEQERTNRTGDNTRMSNARRRAYNAEQRVREPYDRGYWETIGRPSGPSGPSGLRRALSTAGRLARSPAGRALGTAFRFAGDVDTAAAALDYAAHPSHVSRTMRAARTAGYAAGRQGRPFIPALIDYLTGIRLDRAERQSGAQEYAIWKRTHPFATRGPHASGPSGFHDHRKDAVQAWDLAHLPTRYSIDSHVPGALNPWHSGTTQWYTWENAHYAAYRAAKAKYEAAHPDRHPPREPGSGPWHK